MIRRTIAAGAATSVAAALLVPWGTAAHAADLDPDELKPEKASLARPSRRGRCSSWAPAPRPRPTSCSSRPLPCPRATRSQSTAASPPPPAPSPATASELQAAAGRPRLLDLAGHRPVRQGALPLHRGHQRHRRAADARPRPRRSPASTASPPSRSTSSASSPPTRAPSGSARPPSGTAPTSPPASRATRVRASSSASSTPASTRPTRPSRTCVPVADGGDGYDHTNPLGAGKYLGMCDSGQRPTQYVRELGLQRQADRLLQLREPAPPAATRWTTPTTTTATAATPAAPTAGNQVEATAYSAKGTEHEFSVTSTIKGVAPHANIIGYDVCDGGCQGYSILASHQPGDPRRRSTSSTTRSAPAPRRTPGPTPTRWASSTPAPPASTSPPRPATTVPVPRTLGSPGDVPWMTTVGATTHDRKYVASVTGITATDACRPGPTSRVPACPARPTVRSRSSTPAALRQRPVQPARRTRRPSAPSRPAWTCPGRSSSATAAATAASRRASNLADARRRGHDPGQRPGQRHLAQR